MDSRAIYAANDSLKSRVNWIRVSSESEWIYFGAGSDLNDGLVFQKINEFFSDTLLVVVTDRNQSVAIPSNDLPSYLHDILGAENFFIWDRLFKRVMEFNYIGVMRQGYI